MAAFLAMDASRWSSSFSNRSHIDWAVTPEAYIFSASLPGNDHKNNGRRRHHLPPSEENVTLDSIVFTFVFKLAGARKEEITLGIEDSQYVCIETESVGGGRRGLWRKFRLPDGVDVARVSAEFRNGVLSITVPRLAPVPLPPVPTTRFRVDPGDVAADNHHAVARAA
ncbi:18.8 kDa class V heat shock protein [Nymphaea colorata]|nr:18.8 kDa class V heat shock protein [Nymphaea colorata]